MAALREAGMARSVEPEPATLNAPLFRSLVEGMADDRRRVVLDLGPARPETVALFGHYRCRLEIVDLSPDLGALQELAEPDELRKAIARLLPARRDEAVDIVLCWDLLNYLARPVLTTLMRELAGRMARGSLLHALIVYSMPRMAARPARIVPDEQLHLLHVPLTSELRNAPRYTPEDLGKCTPGLAVERAMLLKNGMQEFLFRR
jgi:hypothetical protein